MTIAKFAQVTRTQPCVQNLHMPLRELPYALREKAKGEAR